MDDLLRSTENQIPTALQKTLRALGGIRLSVADVLAKYTDDSGKIPKNKAGAVVNELNSTVQREVYTTITAELKDRFRNTSENTAIGIALAFRAGIDTATLLSIAGVTDATVSFSEELLKFVLSALMRRPTKGFIDNLALSPFNRVDSDGKRLSDRLREVASRLMSELAETLRKSIRKSEVTPTILRKMQKDFRNLADRTKLILETEMLYVMRNGIATFAEYSGVVKALRIQDYPHGKPGEHERHKCYIYAHRDEYGLGMGVYPVKTRKIRHPHPNCRSTLHLIFKEGFGA